MHRYINDRRTPHDAQSCRPSLGGLGSALSPSRAAPHWYDSSSYQLIVALRGRAATALGEVGAEFKPANDQDTLVCAVLTEARCWRRGAEQLRTSRTALVQSVVMYCRRRHGLE